MKPSRSTNHYNNIFHQSWIPEEVRGLYKLKHGRITGVSVSNNHNGITFWKEITEIGSFRNSMLLQAVNGFKQKLLQGVLLLKRHVADVHCCNFWGLSAREASKMRQLAGGFAFVAQLCLLQRILRFFVLNFKQFLPAEKGKFESEKVDCNLNKWTIFDGLPEVAHPLCLSIRFFSLFFFSFLPFFFFFFTKTCCT